MEIKTDKFDGYSLIQVLEKKLDTIIAPMVKSELVLISGSGEKNIIFDISECEFCDSSGLSTILIGNRLCKNNGGVFVVCGLQPAVKKLIEISQLETVISIEFSLKEAIDCIKGIK